MTVVKPAAAAKPTAAPAKEKAEKYSRVDSICDAIKTGKIKTKEELAEVANAIYIKAGGTDNMKESKNIMKYVLPALLAFEVEGAPTE
jgi:hypothetical protein